MYESQGDTILIARQNYLSGLGAVPAGLKGLCLGDPCTSAEMTALKAQYGWKDGKCINKSTGAAAKPEICQALYGKAPEEGFWAKFAKGFLAAQTPTTSTAMPTAQPQMPGWVMPVAIGGGVLVLLLALRKR